MSKRNTSIVPFMPSGSGDSSMMHKFEISRRGLAALVSVIAGCIFVATFLAYGSVLDHGFVAWDTPDYVTDNVHIRSLSRSSFQWMFTTAHAANWHPLTWLSHAIDYNIYGLEPRGHHLTSLILHCMNSVAVLFLALLLLPATRFTPIQRLIAGGLSGLFFGLHPQHVESVVWVAERKDVLCQLFALSTLISYIAYTRTPPDQRTKRYGLYGASLLVFCLALLSKPMAVTLPVVLLLLDIYPLKRIELSSEFKPITPLRAGARILLEKLPFLGCTLAAVALTLWAQAGGNAVMPTAISSLPFRVYNAASAILLYLFQLIVPIGLSPFYPYMPLPGIKGEPAALLPVLVVGGMTIFAIRRWRNGQPLWLTCWALFLVTLSPVIGIIQVGSQGAADRYTYLPTLPFFILFGAAVACFATNHQGRRPLFVYLGTGIACAALAGALFSLTRNQVEIWQDDTTLWTHAASLYPSDIGILINLGDAHVSEERYEEALDTFQRVLEIGNPTEIIERYQRSNAVSPQGRIYHRIAQTNVMYERYPEAIEIYELVLREDIWLPVPRATILYNLAWLQAQQGEYQQAVSILRKALRTDPQHTQAKALLYEMRGKLRAPKR